MKSKKKKGAGAIIALFVCLLLVILYVVLLRYNDKKQAEEEAALAEENAEISAFSIDTANITKFSYPHEGKTITFVYEDETWYNDEDRDFPVDQDIITTMLSSVESITADRIVEETEENYAEYGLDNPSFEVTLYDADGNTYRLMYGDENAALGLYYFAVEGENIAYLVGDTVMTSLDKSLYDTVVMESMEDISTDDITEYTVNNAGDITNFKIFSNSYSSDLSGMFKWFIGSPYSDYRAADSDSLTTYFENFTGISYAGCVDYNATEEELMVYGLSDGCSSVSVAHDVTYEVVSDTEESDSTQESTEETTQEAETITESHQFIMYVGNLTEDGNYYYVRTEGSSAVNLVAAETIDEVMQVKASDYLNKYVGMVNIESVDSVDIDIAGTTYSLGITRNETTAEDGTTTEEELYSVNGADYDEDAFKELYEAIIWMQCESFISDESSIVSADPYITITYHRNTEDYSVVTIEFTEYNSSFYQVTRDGVTEMLVNKSDVADMVSQIEAAIQ